jgi:hypothetical protein
MSRLLALLMCCQVLVCPALCMTKCTPSVDQTGFKAVDHSSSSCQCFPHATQDCSEAPRGPNPENPVDENSDCPDCFCSGSLVISKDTVADIELDEFNGVFVIGMEAEHTGNSFDPIDTLADSSRSLFGRGLLRRYCVLLI